MQKRHLDSSYFELDVLNRPDEYFRGLYREVGNAPEGITEDGFVEHIHRLRERNPNFLEPVGPQNPSQLFKATAGGTYDVARLTAQFCGSYLFTDLRARWVQIERDRREHSAANKTWSPFAKSVQNARLHYLNNLDLAPWYASNRMIH